MHYTYWTLTLMPMEGWVVRRMVKKSTLFAEVEEEYWGLTRSEASDVLEWDSSYVLEQAFLQSVVESAIGDEPH